MNNKTPLPLVLILLGLLSVVCYYTFTLLTQVDEELQIEKPPQHFQSIAIAPSVKTPHANQVEKLTIPKTPQLAKTETITPVVTPLISKNDLIENYPDLWRGQIAEKHGIEKILLDNNAILNIPWNKCQFHSNGFRNEITQASALPFHKDNDNSETWGLEDDQKYDRVHFSWETLIKDDARLIGNWANSAYITQWVSYSPPNDKSIKGGSPVIGLLLTKANNSDQYSLNLLSKIFRSTGFCHDSDNPRNAAHCVKNIATKKIDLNRFNKIDLFVEWDKGPNKPGRVKALINGSLMENLPNHNLQKVDDYYIFPNKQNEHANRLKVGWYVIASGKKSTYKQSANKQNLDMCKGDEQLVQQIKNFAFLSY